MSAGCHSAGLDGGATWAGRLPSQVLRPRPVVRVRVRAGMIPAQRWQTALRAGEALAAKHAKKPLAGPAKHNDGNATRHHAESNKVRDEKRIAKSKPSHEHGYWRA